MSTHPYTNSRFCIHLQIGIFSIFLSSDGSLGTIAVPRVCRAMDRTSLSLQEIPSLWWTPRISTFKCFYKAIQNGKPTNILFTRLKSHRIACLSFCENGALCSASQDRTLRVWNVLTGQCLKLLYKQSPEMTTMTSFCRSHLVAFISLNAFQMWHSWWHCDRRCTRKTRFMEMFIE